MAQMKAGDEVVNLNEHWTDVKSFAGVRGPSLNEYCIIQEVQVHEDGVYLRLRGYPIDNIYKATWFRPLNSSDLGRANIRDLIICMPIYNSNYLEDFWLVEYLSMKNKN